MTDKLNVEIKARCSAPDKVRQILEEQGAEYKGLDHQIDTYFNCPDGRLKLRQGNIENSLIFYKRNNQAGPKESEITMEILPSKSQVGEVLKSAYGVKVVVDKQRHIYFIDNVKFHVDEVSGLGSFMEIEAIDDSASIGREKLLIQCEKYMKLLNVNETDLLENSYSDLLLG